MPLAGSSTANLATEPAARPVICVPFASFLTPCPDARTQRQLLETARPDPHVVQEGAGVEAHGGTLR